jgi:hypothetical protein
MDAMRNTTYSPPIHHHLTPQAQRPLKFQNNERNGCLKVWRRSGSNWTRSRRGLKNSKV